MPSFAGPAHRSALNLRLAARLGIDHGAVAAAVEDQRLEVGVDADGEHLADEDQVVALLVAGDEAAIANAATPSITGAPLASSRCGISAKASRPRGRSLEAK